MKVYPTHPSINIDVEIPNDWSNLSYHNDTCPSFGVHGLQIFVCDDETRDQEGLTNKYCVHLASEYGEHDCKILVDTNDWNEVLEFVNNYSKEKINLDQLDFWIGDMSKEDILKDIILPIANGEYESSQLKKDILNSEQETNDMDSERKE